MNKLQLVKRRGVKLARAIRDGAPDVVDFIPYVVVGAVGIVIRGALYVKSFLKIDAPRHVRMVRSKVAHQVRWIHRGWLRSLR